MGSEGHATLAISAAETPYARPQTARTRRGSAPARPGALHGIEHAAQGPAKRADLDGVEVQRRQLVSENGRRGERPAAVAADLVERQLPLAGRRTVQRDHVDQFRLGPGLARKGLQPERPVVAVPLHVALVEDRHNRLVGLHRLAKELLDGRIIVFLLGEHGDEHVGHLPDGPRPLPIHQGIGIHVRRIQEQEPRRHVPADPPEEQVLRALLERIVGRLPGHEPETLENPFQLRRIAEAGRHQADRVLCPGGQRTDGTRHFSGQVVEQKRLADVCAADDPHDQERRRIELRQQLQPQQIEPIPAGRRFDPNRLGPRRKIGQRRSSCRTREAQARKSDMVGRRVWRLPGNGVSP